MRIFHCLAFFSVYFLTAAPSPAKQLGSNSTAENNAEIVNQQRETPIMHQSLNVSHARFLTPSFHEERPLSELEVACSTNNYDEVTRLLALPTTLPTSQALKTVLDRKNLALAELFLKHPLGSQLIQKKMFKEYCRPGYTNVAEWLLANGYGPLYPSSNHS